MSRRVAREAAMMLLYKSEITQDYFDETLSALKDKKYLEELFEKDVELTEKDFAYIKDNIEGVKENVITIDERIELAAIDWSIARMSKVDLSILRLAVYEIQFGEGVPAQVAINEAVEMAKRYGDDKTAKFINGVLGKIMRTDYE